MRQARENERPGVPFLTVTLINKTYFEIIVGSYTFVKSNASGEILCTLYQFPLAVTSCETVVQMSNQNIDIDVVRTQCFDHKDSTCGFFIVTLTSPSPVPLQTLTTTNPFSPSIILSF